MSAVTVIPAKAGIQARRLRTGFRLSPDDSAKNRIFARPCTASKSPTVTAAMTTASSSVSLDFNLQSFLMPGVEPDDVPTLWALVRARPLVDTFITLFRGGEEEVFIRLHVLREIGARADHPRWLPEELRRHFSYMVTIKL